MNFAFPFVVGHMFGDFFGRSDLFPHAARSVNGKHKGNMTINSKKGLPRSHKKDQIQEVLVIL